MRPAPSIGDGPYGACGHHHERDAADDNCHVRRHTRLAEHRDADTAIHTMTGDQAI
jgi:hypothetical protein